VAEGILEQAAENDFFSKLLGLKLFRSAEILIVCSHPAAVPADELPVFHQLSVLVQIRLQVPDVLQETKMFIMLRMRHFDLSHIYLLLKSWRVMTFPFLQTGLP